MELCNGYHQFEVIVFRVVFYHGKEHALDLMREKIRLRIVWVIYPRPQTLKFWAVFEKPGFGFWEMALVRDRVMDLVVDFGRCFVCVCLMVEGVV